MNKQISPFVNKEIEEKHLTEINTKRLNWKGKQMKVDKYNYVKIFTDNNLSSMEKLTLLDIITEVGDITDKNCFCYLTNEEIARALNCHKMCVSKNISSLVKKGYLERISFNGKFRTLKISLK